MASLELMIAAWEEGHREFSIALEGLADDAVWLRPHPNLLSLGELAGHVAYYEAVMITGPGPDNQPDLDRVPIKSPLVDKAFAYYTDTLGKPVVLGLGAAELVAEFGRVHAEAKVALLRFERDSDDPIPGYAKATWGGNLQYLVFHVAYHAGQAYSVRHLLGHETPDN